ncbi:MAG: WecB/TagA/CpsF family glycosyltransferase [Nitrospiraceae bacterium]|nr:WecB/TagA/CpsF family glycosyltransferase [Nitrospiraceae bacterium]
MSTMEPQSTSIAQPSPSFAVRESVWTPVQSEVMRRLEVDERLPETHAHARLYPYVKRVIDIAFSVGFLIISSPLFIIVALQVLMSKRTAIFQSTPKIGRDCRTFNEFAFTTKRRFVRRLPILLNILRGDLSFIGPRAVSPSEMWACLDREPLARAKSTIRPGLICDWWIRRRASLDYVREVILDSGYAEACSLRKDLSIVLRALPGLITLLLWGDDPPGYASSIRILSVRIDNITMRSAIDRVVEMLDGPGASQVCFINPQNINESVRVPDYKEVLEDADLVLADGFGTNLAGKILCRPIRQNLCGTDLFPRLCAALSGTGRSIYLLGGAPGVADLAAEWVKRHYPGVIVKGWGHGYFSPEEESDVVRKIAQSGADLLVVAMGVPKQELWIHGNLDELNVNVAMGFGGLFDYLAGRVPRAPKWVREVGMEWVYRLIQEPRRLWRRYLIGNGVFLARVFHERLRPHAFQQEQDFIVGRER